VRLPHAHKTCALSLVVDEVAQRLHEVHLCETNKVHHSHV
jgi:hypothetical protein